MESIIERIKVLRAQQSDIEKRIGNDSLTLEQINELDGEWEILDAELSMYDEMLEAATTLAMFEETADLDEREVYVQEREEEYDWTNPTDEDVERWDLERQRMSGWGYEEESTFDLANEV